MTEPTKRPWVVTPDSPKKYEEHIWTDESYGSVLIASCSGMNKRENAELICTAVNSYEAMKEVLEGIVNYYRRNGHKNWQFEKFEDHIRKAQAALALTKKEPQP